MRGPRNVLLILMTLWSLAGGAGVLAQITTSPGLAIEVVATGLPADTRQIAVAPAGYGALGGQIFAADGGVFGNLTDGGIVRVDPSTGVVAPFVSLGSDLTFPVFGPGGAFGADLYVTGNRNPSATDEGVVYRIDASGNIVEFGNTSPPGSGCIFGGAGLAFSTGGAFGEFVYTGTSGGSPSDCVSRLSAAGGDAAFVDDFGTILNGNPAGFVLGDLGAGPRLYVALIVVTGGQNVESGIYAYDSNFVRTALVTGSTTPQLTSAPVSLAFGQGGLFGTDLYVGMLDGGVLRIDGNGAATTVVSGLSGVTSIEIDPVTPDTLYVYESDTRTLHRVTAMPASVPIGTGSLVLLVGLMLAALVWSIVQRRRPLRPIYR